MNSLSEFLSSPLLDFIPRNSPSNNIERPNEIDILLETLSESDIELLNRRVTDDLDDDEHQQDRALLLPTLLISHAIAHASEIPLTIPLTTPL